MIEVEIEHLEFKNRVIFSDTNFVFDSGKKYIVSGISGSGKTTLLHLILGIVTDFKGRVKIEGETPNERTRRKIGYLLQSHPLPQNESVKEYCTSTARLNGVDRHRAKQLVGQYMQILNIEDLQRRKIRELSGGEKQRVALCGELCKDVGIYLLDEPTGSLDGNNSRIIYDSLSSLEGKLVIVVSHSPLWESFGERVTIHNQKIYPLDSI